MNLSLRARVTTSFIVAFFCIFIISILVFHFLHTLNTNLESMAVKSNQVSILTDQVRIEIVSILKNQRRLLAYDLQTDVNEISDIKEKLVLHCEGVTSGLKMLDTFYKDTEIKNIIVKMISYVDSLKLFMEKAMLYSRETSGLQTISELADKILDTFSEFQDIQKKESSNRDRQIKGIVNETKKNMMITLIIGFLSTIILGLVVPGKIALPFKKIKDAIRELQECNFDVSIYYKQKDEIGEIAGEMNKMIGSLKVFEELRIDRINLEMRKFDALANLVKRPVLVGNAQGILVYMNNRMFSLLQVQSDDVLGREMSDCSIPDSIINCYELAIKRRSKIENEEIVIQRKIESGEISLEEPDISDESALINEDIEGATDPAKVLPIVEADNNNSKKKEELIDDKKDDKNDDKKDDTHEIIYQGFANVIPIRGKESAMDYYLMVLSREVFS